MKALRDFTYSSLLRFTGNHIITICIEFDKILENNFVVDSDVDLAFFLGAGYNFNKNFGIEIRAKKGIIPVLDFSESSHTNVVFSLGATYTFDTK